MNSKSNNKTKPTVNIISKYNLAIFIVVVVSGLIGAILVLNYILRVPYDSSKYTPAITEATSFDQTTITRINKLTTSDNNSTNQTLPNGRINPFSE
jgi:hypothetical protein